MLFLTRLLNLKIRDICNLLYWNFVGARLRLVGVDELLL